jgi:hypothetical protein
MLHDEYKPYLFTDGTCGEGRQENQMITRCVLFQNDCDQHRIKEDEAHYDKLYRTCWGPLQNFNRCHEWVQEITVERILKEGGEGRVSIGGQGICKYGKRAVGCRGCGETPFHLAGGGRYTFTVSFDLLVDTGYVGDQNIDRLVTWEPEAKTCLAVLDLAADGAPVPST